MKRILLVLVTLAVVVPAVYFARGKYLASQIKPDQNIATLLINDYLLEVRPSGHLAMYRDEGTYITSEAGLYVDFIKSVRKYQLSDDQLDMLASKITELEPCYEALLAVILEAPGSPLVILNVNGRWYSTYYNHDMLLTDFTLFNKGHHLILEITDILLEQVGIIIDY